MRVLYVAAEAAPIVKVGGLGDVAGSLPLSLKKLGVDIRLAIPWYPEVDTARWQVREFPGGGETRLSESDVPVYLLAKDVFADSGEHKAILGTKEEEQWYARFCQSILEFLRQSAWKPEVLHGNDWHVTEALVGLEKLSVQDLRQWGFGQGNFATLLTIHNLSYHTKVLRLAILAADTINAVSPQYAKEILTPEFCVELCSELNARKADLYGVLNGIDYSVWNPETDPHLVGRYGVGTWKEGKAKNKAALLAQVGLADMGAPLLAFVGRLDPNQKGIKVLAGAVDHLVMLGFQLIVLGTGHRQVEKQLRGISALRPRTAAAVLRYDEELAHLIYAGADALVIPSRFEPCGLIQMIGMRYGTLPIAHAVGGLVDTIRDGETGFLYKDYDSGLIEALERAREVLVDRGGKRDHMVRVAMVEDFSWERSAREYVRLYEKAMEKSGA